MTCSFVSDAAFGQCQTEPFDLHQYSLQEGEQELLRLELSRLALEGDDWASKNVQCVLRYFFLTHRYGLTYDGDFCNVRNVDNIITLLEVRVWGLGSWGLEGYSWVDLKGGGLMSTLDHCKKASA